MTATEKSLAQINKKLIDQTKYLGMIKTDVDNLAQSIAHDEIQSALVEIDAIEANLKSLRKALK